MKYFKHETAVIDDNVTIDDGVKIWHYSHICKDAIIGKNVNLGQNVFVGNKVIIGNNCKIQNNVSVYDGVTLEEDVFMMDEVELINPITIVKEALKNLKETTYKKPHQLNILYRRFSNENNVSRFLVEHFIKVFDTGPTSLTFGSIQIAQGRMSNDYRYAKKKAGIPCS